MSLTGKPALAVAAPIENDGFWLDVSTADLMGKYRIPAEYVGDVITWGLTLAVVRVNAALVNVKNEIIIRGFATLEAYLNANSEQVGGFEIIQTHYEHAIYARAKASLLQQFNTMNRRDSAENQAKESEDTEQYWLDESAQSIAALQGAFFPDDVFIANHSVHVALI